MPSVVIDASTLVGALLKADSIPERALTLARAHDVMCMSCFDIRARQADPGNPIRRRHLHHPVQAVADCRDAKDNKYLELALAASADTIVSSDRDLLDLSPWRGIAIISPAAYVARFEPG